MTPRSTPTDTEIVFAGSYGHVNDSVLQYLGDGFDVRTFKARCLSSTTHPDWVNTTSNEYSREEWRPKE